MILGRRSISHAVTRLVVAMVSFICTYICIYDTQRDQRTSNQYYYTYSNENDGFSTQVQNAVLTDNICSTALVH